MFTDIDLYSPDFHIDCSTISNPSKVYTIFRDNGIKKAYVYAMGYRSSPFQFDFLKVGLSNPALTPARKSQVGERVVRQLAWVPGWRTSVTSANGFDFWNGVQLLIADGIISKNFNKDLLTVGVWDISKRMPKLKVFINSTSEPVEWAEGELSHQYEQRFGWRPRLNERNPATCLSHKQGYVDMEMFATNFV